MKRADNFLGRQELFERIYLETGVDGKTVESVLDGLIAVIKKETGDNGRPVYLTNLGVFHRVAFKAGVLNGVAYEAGNTIRFKSTKPRRGKK